MASNSTIYNKPVEDVIRTFADGEFGAVFTMAVLEHIHSESDWILGEAARVAGRVLITVEDEQAISWKHFRRNYKEVFEPLGMKQVEEIDCTDVEGLGRAFYARVFVREGRSPKEG